MGKVWLSIACLFVLTACATSHVLVGSQRPPVPVESVRVYLDPPQAYENIAILSSSSQGAFAFTSQQKTNKVMERLKEEAASLGANGILIQGIGSSSRGAVVNTFGNSYGSGFVGTGVAIPVMVTEGSAIAIYVMELQAPAASLPTQQPIPGSTPQPATQPNDGCVSCQNIGEGF